MKKALLCTLPVVALTGIAATMYLNIDTSNQATDGFEFPSVTLESSGEYRIETEGREKPINNYSRTLDTSNAPKVDSTTRTAKKGDIVKLRYQMLKWSTGALIDSSGDYPIEVVAGMPSEAQASILKQAGAKIVISVPQFLSESVLGTSPGVCNQVVFKANLSDLPEGYDSKDGYVLIVNVSDVRSPDEYRDELLARVVSSR